MRRTLVAAVLAACASILLPAAESAPKLVVVIVVDQMRADYIERFHDNWSAGLRRLVDDGAWFTDAAYPYLSTVTCVGHATISTGAYPHVHGIVGNTWFDRRRSAVVPCTDDARVRAIAYGRSGDDRPGPGNLEVPSLADQIRGNGGRVVTLALKARSAIMLAGHGGDAVTWVSETLDSWETSTAFAPAPVPHVQGFLAGSPMSADYGKTWTRLMPASAYRDVDDGLGEDPPQGWTATFPHVLNDDSGNGKPDTAFYDRWQHSPFADAYVSRMAAALADDFELGTRDRTDFLGVSFSSPDLVGHQFGPRSQEVQDMLARLDGSIGALLNRLDRRVGAGNYVVALSADHGVTDIPEQLKAAGRDGGRIRASALLNAAETQARADLGVGRYLDRLVENGIYFAPGMYEKVKANPRALRNIVNAVSSQPGVQHVYTGDELANAAGSSDTELRAAAMSYYPGRSGELLISQKPGWILRSVGTTHGSGSADDRRVPVLLFGRGIKAGRYAGAASPADVAPTLAALAGVALPRAEGRVLREALH